ncbi:MAG: GAF domain-containing protein [Deltaproteobacteria bacterium]|nr:GAF domain-containing protein [Deltaproteobacteria bacterium]
MKDDKVSSLFDKGEEFLEIFRKGQEFTLDLLKDNEQLRYRVVKLEESLKSRPEKSAPRLSGDKYEELARKVALYERKLRELEGKLNEVEEENIDFAQRYIDVDEQNNNLANLYVASFQLHSTLDYEEVLQIILEIIINLIGAEEFAIFLLDEKREILIPVAAEGVDPEKISPVTMGEGVTGVAARSKESYFNENPPSISEELLENPLVCIPLMIKDELIGMINLYKLFQQKKGFVPVDFELFTLLAGHAATAIFSSRLYSESRRKLTTYKGFLNLLSQ